MSETSGRRPWLVIAGALLAFAAVAAGAFAAHLLTGRLPPDQVAVVTTAAHYQLFHALGAVMIGLAGWPRGKLAGIAGWLMVVGAVLFSGSLYLLVGGAPPPIAWVTPFGGTSFLAGWLVLAIAAWRERG